MRFDGPYVTGMLVLGQENPEAARREAIRHTVKQIKYLKERYPTDAYGHVKRHKAFLRTLTHPWRKHTRRFGDVESILEIMELPQHVYQIDHWLSLNDNQDHLCNVPRERTQDPKYGYICSQPDLN